MSVIKSAEAPCVRPIHEAGSHFWAQGAPAVSPLETLQAQLDAQAQQLQSLRAVIEDLPEQLNNAFLDGEVEGRALGLAEADAREDERLIRLEVSLGQAVEALTTQLRDLQSLAVAMAREALGKILGDPSAYADLTLRIIETQVRQLGVQAVVGVEVSAQDFPHASPLQALSQQFGLPSLTVNATAERPSGDCMIKLGLGALQVGVTQQWASVDRLLSEMLEPEPV